MADEKSIQVPVDGMMSQSRTNRVEFTDKVHVHEIPKIEVDLIPELFYSKFDFRRFKSEEKFREERAVARAIRRLVGHAVTDMEARLGSCEALQNTERELLSQSFQEPAAEMIAISSDEDSDDGEEEMEQTNVKPLVIREERVKARRRTSLLSMPSYVSHGFEDENIGLQESFSFIDQSDMAFNQPLTDLTDLSCLDLNSSNGSMDLTFNPVDFDTVLDVESGRPCR